MASKFYSAATSAREILNIRHSGTVGHLSFLRNFCMGAGLAYAIKEEKYWHIPFIIIWASPYVGYQTYKNSDRILNYAKQQCPAYATRQVAASAQSRSSFELR